MTSFKLLVTLLSVVAASTASTILNQRQANSTCDIASCGKALASLPVDIFACIEAADDIKDLSKPKKANPSKTGFDIADCALEMVKTGLDIPKSCGPCIQDPPGSGSGSGSGSG